MTWIILRHGSVLGPILFLVYCADVMAIAHRHGLGVHSYTDDSQLYYHADISVADDKVQQLLVCVEEISHWMNGNRLKINKDKTQFVWLGLHISYLGSDAKRSHLAELTSRYPLKPCVLVSCWIVS